MVRKRKVGRPKGLTNLKRSRRKFGQFLGSTREFQLKNVKRIKVSGTKAGEISFLKRLRKRTTNKTDKKKINNAIKKIGRS